MQSGKKQIFPLHRPSRHVTRSGGLDPLILEQGTKWASVVSRPGRFTLGEGALGNLLNTDSVSPQPVWRLKTRKISCPCRDLNPVSYSAQRGHYWYASRTPRRFLQITKHTHTHSVWGEVVWYCELIVQFT
jgi:hypothetical protein